MNLKFKEILVILLGLTSVSLLSYLLYNESFSKQKSSNEPIGTVVYRHKVAQRRDAKSFVWENVNQKDFVYNHDSIRTDELAEAIITLNNGIKIELDPFSMIVININQSEFDLELDRGSLNLDSENPGDLTIRSKGDIVNTKTPGKWKLARDKNQPLTIQSYTNNSIIVNGESQNLTQGIQAEILGGKIKSSKLSLELISPNDNERLYPNIEHPKITLSWKQSEKEVTVLIGKDRNFDSPILREKTLANFIETSLDDGTYFWKVASSNDTSEIRRIRIKTNKPISLITPEDNQSFQTIEEKTDVYFAWNELELGNNYKLEFSTRSDFKSIYFTTQLNRLSYTHSLPKGDFFWRVHANGAFKEISSVSETRKISIVNETDPKIITQKIKDDNIQPEPKKEIPKQSESISFLFPKNSSTIDMSKLDYLDFIWKEVSGSTGYSFKLVNLTEGGKLVMETNVQKSKFRLLDLSKLDKAKFKATVETTEKTGTILKAETIFSIILKDELEKPSLE
ncbi:MAG: hypothetical protein SFU98_10725 [Leptospiraceae bacterium]|nr:hypothetical protein [Leptospiraceae bacterium]